MKKSNLPFFIPCPLHPHEFIQRISVDPSSSKDLFCIECMIEHEISNSTSLQSLEDFLAGTFAFYSAQNGSNGVTPTFEPPLETLNVLKNKAGILQRLEKHLSQEKIRVKELFSTISDSVIKVINEKRDHYLELLDQQLTNLEQNYTFFEEQLKKGFPRHADNLSTLSSEEVIKTSFAHMDDFTQLSHYVKRIKKDFAKNDRGLNVYQLEHDKRKTYFSRLLNMLEIISSNKPTFDYGGLDAKLFSEDIKKHIDGSLDKLINIKQTILAGGLSFDELESQILKPEHFEVIRNCVPKEYSFALKLLYRASQHGFTPEEFHSRCDKRGATITIIECQFLGSKKKTVIGAFLDQDWHNKESYISSEEAFLFSVDTGIKCVLGDTKCAAYGGSYLPIFGEGFDICICNNLKQSFVHPKSYRNAQSLVNPEVYTGPDRLYYFIPYNIEVYALR